MMEWGCPRLPLFFPQAFGMPLQDRRLSRYSDQVRDHLRQVRQGIAGLGDIDIIHLPI
ncbi:hypothetical protein ACVWW2_006494 [Bradyrhizobium sp. LM4.3]